MPVRIPLLLAWPCPRPAPTTIRLNWVAQRPARFERLFACGPQSTQILSLCFGGEEQLLRSLSLVYVHSSRSWSELLSDESRLLPHSPFEELELDVRGMGVPLYSPTIPTGIECSLKVKGDFEWIALSGMKLG